MGYSIIGNSSTLYKEFIKSFDIHETLCSYEDKVLKLYGKGICPESSIKNTKERIRDTRVAWLITGAARTLEFTHESLLHKMIDSFGGKNMFFWSKDLKP